MELAEYVEDVGSGITVFAIKQRHRGGTASFRRLDVTDAADVQRFVADATDTYGGVDVMINNAGVMPLSALAENKVDEWNRMIDVNIRGVLHGISAALPVMRAQGGAHRQSGLHRSPRGRADRGRVLRHEIRGLGDLGGLRKEQSGNIREAACAQRCRKIRSWSPCKR